MPLRVSFSYLTQLLLVNVFGPACWSHLRSYNKQKLFFQSKECVFLGYSFLRKWYKCLDTNSCCVYISRDVIFDENIFSFKKAPPSSSPTLQPTHNAPDLSTFHLGNSNTNLENDHMHICVPINSLDAVNLVLTSASGLPLQSSTSLPRESASIVLPMIGASDPLQADDIMQCPIGSSVAGRPTAVAPIAPLATAGTTVPSVVDPPPTTHPYGT